MGDQGEADKTLFLQLGQQRINLAVVGVPKQLDPLGEIVSRTRLHSNKAEEAVG
ncbi:hypothetical protein D3C71_2240030 [compost metagenome]